MGMFCKGDRVRLTNKFIDSMTYKHHKTSLDWRCRNGSVVSANGQCVRVLWDGRKSLDDFDPRVLEKL